jgi:signal transduction histidine kinase
MSLDSIDAPARPKMTPAVPAQTRGVVLHTLLAAAGAGIALVSAETGSWHPIALLGSLAATAVAADFFLVLIAPGVSITAALAPIVLAGIFLGPLPAAAIGACSSIAEGLRRRIARIWLLQNTSTYVFAGVVAGALARALDIRQTHGLLLIAETASVYVIASLITLVFASSGVRPDWWQTALSHASATYSAEGLLAVATGLAALLYSDGEDEALISLVVLVMLFDHFARALVRARQLARESLELAEREARLTARLAEAQSRARRDLAEALHSGPVQTLLSVRQDLGESDLGRAQLGADATLAELRNVMIDFHVPYVPDNARTSLDGLARALQQRHSVDIDVRLDDFDGLDVTERGVRLAFDAAQELLRNAAKHAHATKIRCSIELRKGLIVVEVADDGIGLDDARLNEAVTLGHVGLAALRARLVEEGGGFKIGLAPAKGTLIRVTVPVQE